MYCFSVAAITNYHTVCGLKQHKFLNESYDLKSSYQQSYIPSRGTREKYTSLSFLASSGHLYPFDRLFPPSLNPFTPIFALILKFPL